MSQEYPLRVYQRVIFLGLDGFYHTAKVISVIDQNRCTAQITPTDVPRILDRDFQQSWRGGSFFIEVA